MLAKREEFDVANEYELARLSVEKGFSDDFFQVGLVARGEERHRLGMAHGRV